MLKTGNKISFEKTNKLGFTGPLLDGSSLERGVLQGVEQPAGERPGLLVLHVGLQGLQLGGVGAGQVVDDADLLPVGGEEVLLEAEEELSVESTLETYDDGGRLKVTVLILSGL